MRHIVLVGLMGTGKSTVGRLLARRLGWPLRDSDADIEARTGGTVRELHGARGVEAMHALEARVLLEALADTAPSVICAAASTVDDEACRRAIREGSRLVVWLTAPPATAAGRFDDGSHRPRFDDDPEVLLVRQAAERGPRFRSLDPLELSADDGTPDALADRILEALAVRG